MSNINLIHSLERYLEALNTRNGSDPVEIASVEDELAALRGYRVINRAAVADGAMIELMAPARAGIAIPLRAG